MARDPADVVIHQTYQARAEAYTAALGATTDSLSDLEFHQIANELLRENLASLHQGARVLAGDSIELPPDLAARLAAAGASDQQVREFASQVHQGDDATTALHKFDRDIK